MELNRRLAADRSGVSAAHVTRAHPCFSGEAHATSGRIHLPVAPACNIRCAFCRRSVNATEDRPGVTGVILSPEEAIGTLEKALRLCPQITVAGIAGPGDPLATDHALRTFALVDERFPGLIKCLSTNGLRLARKAEEIVGLGVRTVTVTVNAVDPGILAKICLSVNDRGVLLSGVAGAQRLIDAQREGIRKATDLGAIVKVNIVLVPGVNSGHVGEISRTVAAWGAAMVNVIPLIPQYAFADAPPPDCVELREAREAAETHLPVFRHCRQCRADAAGIPGVSEFRDVLYGEAPMAFSHG